jgi:hypothetical protein
VEAHKILREIKPLEGLGNYSPIQLPLWLPVENMHRAESPWRFSSDVS